MQSVDALIAVSSFTVVKHGIREMVLRSEKQCCGVERLLSGGWAKGVSLVTASRLPSATHEPAIGYETPDAACRDSIALIEDGDTNVIHLKNRLLYLGLSEESLTGRTKRYEPQLSHITWDYLRHNADYVIPASEGVPMPIDGLQAE